MKIVSKWRINGIMTEEQVKKDFKKIKQNHEKALKEHPMWDMFGGVISIDDRRYQVMP